MRAALYRFAMGRIAAPVLGSRLLSSARREAARQDAADRARLAAQPAAEGEKRVWFHGASVGELESLWTVVRAHAAAAGGRAWVTAFSESAGPALSRFKRELAAPGLAHAGYAPLEGSWLSELAAARPQAFVTARYEAWPELWDALGRLGIPLVVVCAQARGSLDWAHRASRALGQKLPRRLFLAVTEADAAAMRARYPGCEALAVGDPRWDRVHERFTAGHPRAAELLVAGEVARLPRPWGVLGSAWPEDVALWSEALPVIRGTVWVVPHRVDAAHADELERGLAAVCRSPVARTGGRRAAELFQAGPLPRQVVLVDEAGFLSELYGAADWAYVGGGFGDGVHSTLEPAIHGIPLVAGSKGAERFTEIAELRATGQLTLVEDAAELDGWLWKRAGAPNSERARWRADSQARFGATRRVLAALPGA